MQMGTQIREEVRTKPASFRSGSESTENRSGLAALEGVVPEVGTHPAVAWNILTTRRGILDRVFNQRKNQATRLRHEAEAESCFLRLAQERENLESWAVKDLQGRADEARARAELCVELSHHYELEIASLRATLSSRPATLWVRLRRKLSLLLWV